MAQIYANLIRKKLRTINDVPEHLKPEVELLLAANNG
ncbi:CD1375 family protein [Paenibacillus silviterrae]|nr:CD1375 family protein [Paenibacillus chinjuensis]